MITPPTTSSTWCLPNMIREMETLTAHVMIKNRHNGEVTKNARKKQTTLAARVVWPLGKENLSTETVANISILL